MQLLPQVLLLRAVLPHKIITIGDYTYYKYKNHSKHTHAKGTIMRKYGLIMALLLTTTIMLDGCGNNSTNAGKNETGTVTQNGQSTQTGDVISEEDAKAIALEHAGLSEDETTFLKAKLEMDDGVQEYEIEFYTVDKEYDYNIDAASGEIRSFDNELENRTGTTANGGNAAVTIEDASALALEKVQGATDADIRINEEMEDGRSVYEGTILYENKKYDFQIDATTGEFIEWEID